LTDEAVLDWDTATVGLPLDRFGMTVREQRLVQAAANIVFARCATGVVPPETLDAIRIFLDAPPKTNHWLFGYWDAEYLAKHGLQLDGVGELGLLDTDQETLLRCTSATGYLALEVVSADVQTSDGISDGLARWYVDSIEKTVVDERFLALKAARERCLAEAGFEVDPESRLGGAVVDPGWPDERVLKTMLAEATCSDELDFTQQAGDLCASYQAEYAQVNEAELVAIRAIAADRVAKADNVLKEAGAL
jgi:hypothetical protein